jgi:hypothetical protein
MAVRLLRRFGKIKQKGARLAPRPFCLIRPLDQ